MTTVALIFSKHSSPVKSMPVRGELFAASKFKELAEGSERVKLFQEDVFTGMGPELRTSAVRRVQSLIEDLKRQTEQYLRARNEIHERIDDGKEDKRVHAPLFAEIAARNRLSKGSVEVIFQHFDLETQLMGIEATAMREEAYRRFLGNNHADGPAKLLFQSILLREREVLRRDAILLAQIRAELRKNSSGLFIVNIGSSHRYLAAKARDLLRATVESHIQPEEPFQDYDYALRMRLEKGAGESAIMPVLKRDLVSHMVFVEMLYRYNGQGVAMEDLVERSLSEAGKRMPAIS